MRTKGGRVGATIAIAIGVLGAFVLPTTAESQPRRPPPLPSAQPCSDTVAALQRVNATASTLLESTKNLPNHRLTESAAYSAAAFVCFASTATADSGPAPSTSSSFCTAGSLAVAGLDIVSAARAQTSIHESAANALGAVDRLVDTMKSTSGAELARGLPHANRLHDDIVAADAAIVSCVTRLQPAPGTSLPPRGGLGAACDLARICEAPLVCRSSKCARVGIVAGGTCDANQICLPGLECRSGTCRLPCVCPVPACFIRDGACMRGDARTVRKDCATVRGVCGPPCFRDASQNCKIDTLETVPVPCALTCS